uniref:Integrin alpha-8-like isoform X1 n=2 Tax=Crassostrea virginica TaxID=6565 RepID=A0A8B8C6K3_CRAVI|nr:integrin alpha-8-like isoform X1 [Crassostrea virginica]
MAYLGRFLGSYCYIFLLDVLVQSFLLDTNNFTVYQGPTDSLFGYSVALLNNSQGIWALVGAPRADDVYQPWVRTPGALFRCRVSWSPGTDCEQVNVDNSGNTEERLVFHRRSILLHSDKNNQWLGVSLDVDPEKQSSVLICAHRWKDNYLNLNYNGISHMNGICYQLNASLSRTARKIPALTIRERLVHRDRYTEFSMGGLGTSAMFTGVSGYMLFGAPGLNDWSGGAVIEREGSNTNDVHYIEPPRSTYQDSQIGSSLSVGNYLYRTTKSLAMGAPRINKVFIYEWMDRKRHPIVTLENKQIGSRFGSSLLTYRTGSANFDDIIVGAPYFSGHFTNEGCVFLYKSKGILGFHQRQILHGRSSAHAQFGASIGLLGDLNSDGFNEIVVGAPFEADGRGAVYVFNGHRSGIWSEFTQHVQARNVNMLLRGFGVSFSRPMSIENKTVLAVGSHLSSHAVILRSTVILDIDASFIQTSSEACHLCVAFKVCFQTKRQGQPKNVVMNFTVRMDEDIYHTTNLTKETNRSSVQPFIEDHVVLTEGKRICSDPYHVFINSIVEGKDGIKAEVDYMVENSNSSIVLNRFHGDKENPVSTSRYMYKFPYSAFCKAGNGCRNALWIHHQWKNMVNRTYVVVDPGIVTLRISVSNHQVAVNNATLLQITPSEMFFYQAVNRNTNRTLSCLMEGRFLQCFVGYIKENETVVLHIQYEIRRALTNKLTVTVQSTLNSNLSDKGVFEQYSVKALRTPYTNVKRCSQPSSFLMVDSGGEKQVGFRHTFSVSLLYPGDREFVHFLLPVAGRAVSLTESQVNVQHGRAEMKCAWDNLTHTAEEFELISSLETCKHAVCDLLTCEIRPISEQVTLTVAFHLLINPRTWIDLQPGSLRTVFSSFLCYKSRFVIQGVDPFCVNITTRIKDISQGWADGRVHYWFVTLAVFAGVAIVLFLSLLLWKCGFFYRKALQELKLKTEIQKLSYVHLLQAQRNTSEETDSETFVLTPFPSGSDDTQVMTPPPGYQEATQRTSTSSTECFFTYCDDDGYLQPVFDIT